MYSFFDQNYYFVAFVLHATVVTSIYNIMHTCFIEYMCMCSVCEGKRVQFVARVRYDIYFTCLCIVAIYLVAYVCAYPSSCDQVISAQV